MAFDNVRLPEEIEQGAAGGPSFQTSIIVLSSGREQRNGDWSEQRASWDVGYGMMRKEDYEEIIEFFYARRGRLRGFRFKDWTDYEATDVLLGVGDGVNTQFQLIKRYGSGDSEYIRRITRPVTGTLAVRINGTPTGAYTISSTGLITFSSPVTDLASVNADFEFDIPVRFDVDKLSLSVTWEDAAEVPSIPIVELRE